MTPLPVAASRPLMGGRVSVHVLDEGDPARLGAAAERVLDRVAAWAGRFTRFSGASELSRLNASADHLVAVGPSMTALLDWARTAEALSDGIVDVAMLDARIAAEAGQPVSRPLAASRRWSLERGARGAAVRRAPGVLFDLDGVAKGWLADRALAIAPGRSALVDGDGDLSARVSIGDEFQVGIADPREEGRDLGVIRLGAEGTGRRWGLATSGTSVHRWERSGAVTHHLIDPATWRPATTDVVQATVLADTARAAEAFAKVAVLAGVDRAPALLDRPGVHGVLMLTMRGDVRATPGMLRWLA